MGNGWTRTKLDKWFVLRCVNWASRLLPWQCTDHPQGAVNVCGFFQVHKKY